MTGRDAAETRPRFEDIDQWGLTHPGTIRKTNEDHFFLGSVSRGVIADLTSLDADPHRVVEPERLASLAMVADGVGSGGGGELAARSAVEALVQEISNNFDKAYVAESKDPEAFTKLLSDAALACHESLVERAEHDSSKKRFATTLTLFLGLWPHAYVLQVGDSRLYLYHDGEFHRVLQDQTMAQEFVDQGILTQTKAHRTRWAHVLSSAIGGEQVAPVVTKITRDWGTIVLLCTDGLTKHVTDDRIKERMASLTSARQLCEALLQDALDDGGTDNISLVVGRTIPPDERR